MLTVILNILVTAIKIEHKILRQYYLKYITCTKISEISFETNTPKNIFSHCLGHTSCCGNPTIARFKS